MANNISFEKLYNFRDIGGMQTKDGEIIKRNLLYRSEDISRLSKRDQLTLKQTGLKLICDLRTIKERESKMYSFPEKWGTIIMHIPINHGSQELTYRDFYQMLKEQGKQDNFENWIHDFYQSIVCERKQEIKQVIEAIANHNNTPALIHCTGGKDRTGFISALIQLYLGVDYNVVVKEYLLSNQLIYPKMKKTEKMIRLFSLYRIPTHKIKPLLIVDKSYLDGALKQVFSQYESVERFFVEGCGISNQTLCQLKCMMLDQPGNKT
ncbi:tyrosine-protein phosphatase [Metabacillus malikii]|uniref:Protein-tyrosine phosphatase n=1 Tax=Metabacillus malikii TaxID=1504265 RepID=A0ABT9ZC68_9BACI|nr:tyrosine-protein phosphatase [Metabacillus malikii]MDQ0229432.1 protein-tyrosine phosphatase [Metabacillus malikii]